LLNTRYKLWALALLSTAVVACESPVESPVEGTPLREVSIPEDFKFETTQTVGLDLTVADAVYGDRVDAAVEITKPNGATVFRGAIKKGHDLSVQIPVPRHIDHLDVTVRGADGAKQTRVDFAGSRAVATVE
jgi:hypothetical protein